MSEDIARVSTDAGVLGGQLVQACPFCGEQESFEAMIGIAIEIDENGGETELSTVTCLECGANGPFSDSGLPGAVSSWNDRA